MSDLQQLDEALDYLNETNIIKKLIEYRNKKKKEKAINEKDKRDIAERGYTDSDYKRAKENIKTWIKWSELKPINIMNLDNFDLPFALAYCNISESQFVSSFNKFGKNKDNVVYYDDFPLDEDDPIYKLFDENECYEIGDTIGSPYLFYFPKLRKFLEFYNDDEDKVDNLVSYNELVNQHMNYLKSNNSRLSKSYIAADKELDYNKLQ